MKESKIREILISYQKKRDKAESDFYKSNKHTCIECVKKINYESRV